MLHEHKGKELFLEQRQENNQRLMHKKKFLNVLLKEDRELTRLILSRRLFQSCFIKNY